MRQGIIFIFIFILLSVTVPGKEVQSEQKEMIPDEAIRLRILANSDSEADQAVKYDVRDNVNQYISSLVEQMTNIDDARATVREELPEIEQIVYDTLEQEGIDDDFQVEYGSNIEFPEKEYGPYVYPAGEYEAVMITIGEGQGKNWWCVLFPPLCYVDVSEDSSVEDNTNEEPSDQETTDDELENEENNDSNNQEDTNVNNHDESNDDEDNNENGANNNDDEELNEDDVETSFFLLEWLDWS